jgi:bacteriocin biosynthesis cyclodehydratase domain-containing protein
MLGAVRERCLAGSAGSEYGGEIVPAGPLLLPGLRLLWRGRDSLQIGCEPGRSVVLDRLGPVTAQVLAGLDGRRSAEEVLAEAAARGLDPAEVHRIISELREKGVVVDGEDLQLSALGSPDIAERLEPDQVALGLARSDRAPVTTLRARRERLVLLHGGGRLGAPVGALLAAAGVGRLAVVDRAQSRPCDAAPAGIAAEDVFAPRQEAAIRAIRRAAPEADVGPLQPGHQPDIAVLAENEPVDMMVRIGLNKLGVPHLPISVMERTAVIGPLVIPGRSACLTCGDIERTEFDEHWPALLTQLANSGRRQRQPADVVLTTMAAALAAMQVLELLDGGHPSSVGGSLEVRSPGLEVRRRTWQPHPECDCGAAAPVRQLAG